MGIEERKVELKMTKKRLTEDEAKALNYKKGVSTQQEPGEDCGEWFVEYDPIQHETWTCRICMEGYPTRWPVKHCVLMPD